MHEHHITVPRTARYFTLGDSAPAVADIWFVCHGYGQLAARFLRQFEPLAGPGGGERLIVAPEALSRFYLEDTAVPAQARKVGATWMTREDRLHEIDDYVRYLDELHAVVVGRAGRVARVTALGFSQGAATVSRWAALGRSRLDRVLLWGGELPPDLDLAAARERLRAVRLTLVYGRQDEFITEKVAATITARLREHDIPHQLWPFDGGHELDTEILRQIAADV
jgi:predicted esterase